MNRIALGLSLAASSIAFGQVLAYEPFQYPAGNLSGKDGGIGFAEPWQQTVTTNSVTSSSLEIDGIITTGNRLTEGGGYVESYRTLSQTWAPADADNPVATEIWFSVHAALNENNDHDPFFECFTGVTLIRENGDEALRLGQAWSDGVWGYSQPFVTDVRSTVNMDSTARLLVVKMSDPGTGAQDCVVDFWVDPPLSGGEPAADPTLSGVIYGGGFNRIKVAAGQNGGANWLTDYDEIKIGVSFEEVTTGVPSIAYEGFDYLENDIDSTMNGGVGFAGPWTEAPPVNRTVDTGISTSCAEGIGGSGQTGGNGAGAFRYLESSYGTSGEPETVYYSLVARTNPDNPVAEGELGWYAGASLFNGDAEVLFLGKPWAADSWGFDAQDGACDGDVNGCGFSSVQFSDTPSLIVVKMDFDGVGGATTSLWVDPADCAEGTPEIVYEDANNPGFNRIRFQAGNGPAYMDFDEVRLGRSWDDVVPNDGGGGNDCPEDINGDGIVGFGDVLEALSAWGSSGGAADVDGDGTVAFGDVLAVLSAFGPC